MERRKRFFFEKKKQKTFPGCFARSWTIEPILKRRRHSNVRMPAALAHCLGGPASCEAPGKSFLVLFSKKEHPSFRLP
jgi:hypothetical protein